MSAQIADADAILDKVMGGRGRPRAMPDPSAVPLPEHDEGLAADDPERHRSWRPVDLTDVLEGRYQRAMPTVGARADGVGLFYPGRIHSISSESEAGKTWVALHACAHELANGRAVAYLDFEDDEGGVVGRLLALGAAAAHIRDRFAYIRPEDGINVLGNRQDLADVLGDLQPTLVVLDGITEAMSLHGLELKDNSDIARFGQMLPRWIAAQGPAVTTLDHVVKDRDGRGRYALGGVHKLNIINGAAFTMENREPFGIGITGRSGLYIAKDRPGQLRRHAVHSAGGMRWFADLVLCSHDETSVEATLEAPNQQDRGPFRPTVLMRKVSEALEKAGRPLTKTEITDRVRGRATDIRMALAVLVDEGYVRPEPGQRNAVPHSLIKPFEG